jgi:hypothetical protein
LDVRRKEERRERELETDIAFLVAEAEEEGRQRETARAERAG